MLVLADSGIVQLKGDSVASASSPQGAVLIRMAQNNAGELTATLGVASIVSIVALLRPVWTNRALCLQPLACDLALLCVTLAIP